jgi:beta-galactosidase GanA
VLRVDVDGRLFGHGSRGHASHVSPIYRREVARIVGALASRYGSHPCLVAWQIDNELMGDVDGDYSPLAEAAWHEFLRLRYGTIAELNRRWATAVWSETYDAFDQVPMLGKIAPDCQVLGRWTDGPVAGVPWAVERPLGQGRIIVLGAMPVGAFGRVLDALGLTTQVRRHPCTWGSMVIPRGRDHQGLLAVNWDGQGGSFVLPWPAMDVRTQKPHEPGEVQLAAFQVLALRRSGASTITSA